MKGLKKVSQGAMGCPASTCRALAIARLRTICSAWTWAVAPHSTEQEPGEGAKWRPGLHLAFFWPGYSSKPSLLQVFFIGCSNSFFRYVQIQILPTLLCQKPNKKTRSSVMEISREPLGLSLDGFCGLRYKGVLALTEGLLSQCCRSREII